MRKALYAQVNTITDFGSRVFQPYSAPDGTTTPYAVIKIYGDDEVPYNRCGSMDSFSVFIYDSPNSYLDIDGLEKDVREALDGVELTTDTGNKFIPDYVKTLKDAYDSDRNLVYHSVDFDVAGARPT